MKFAIRIKPNYIYFKEAKDCKAKRSTGIVNDDEIACVRTYVFNVIVFYHNTVEFSVLLSCCVVLQNKTRVHT